MRTILLITLIAISALCNANDYFDKKYYSDFYCIKLAEHSKRLAYAKDDSGQLNNKEVLEAVKLTHKAAIEPISNITDDQKEDMLHVIDIVYDNDYYGMHLFSEATYKYCINKYITKR